MTDLAALLAKLRELEGKATKGPWRAGRRDMTSYGLDGKAFKNIYTPQDEDEVRCGTGAPIEDAAFIAASRNIMGLLLDVVEVARAVAMPPRGKLATQEQRHLLEALSRLAAAKVGP